MKQKSVKKDLSVQSVCTLISVPYILFWLINYCCVWNRFLRFNLKVIKIWIIPLSNATFNMKDRK